MSLDEACNHCNGAIPLEYTFCPHCGIQLICPNVRLASSPEEYKALEKKYKDAKYQATQRGCSEAIKKLENELKTSKAVIGCSISKLLTMARKSGTFANYYDLMSYQFLTYTNTDEPDWAKLRPQVEIEFMGSHKNIDQLHYACLSTTRESLPHYGECTVILNDHMIEHRSSVFIENSALFFFVNGPNIPSGHRSTWVNRTKLGTVKLADDIKEDATLKDIANLIMKCGETARDDDFLEVQIFGDMTIRTFEHITLRKTFRVNQERKRTRLRRGTASENAIKELCKKANVNCEVV
ncbi:hypothetical protein [Gimesia aquarii]|uniref:Uncharacterized protein n=1 Tax=Gimesia aquarii TaxID=2527964 RepID=A0A517W3P8_9PLAN|nr:hypothetical protein [Gimesia aquarii]QDT99879.1 hypothetical protein V144x_53930 [Gimesia aquarii]